MKNLGYDMKNRDLVNPLKGVALSEEMFLTAFLDQKMSQNAKMTGDMRSTLKSLENRINISSKGVILESDSNDDEDHE